MDSHRRRVLRILFLCLSASPSLALAADSGHPACEPKNKIKPVLARFSEGAAAFARERGAWDEFDRDFQTVLADHPADVHLNRLYQDVHDQEPASLVERYRALAAERPEDPAALSLYGRILLLLERPDAEGPLLAALQRDPGYPWAHYALARLYEVMLPDAGKAQAHLVGFFTQCPMSPLVLARLGNITAPDLARRVASSVRTTFQARRDPALAPQLEAVWKTEFKALPPDEHAAVRERVKADLALLRAPDLVDDARVLGALIGGYAVVGDEDGLAWAIDTMARRFPASERARQAAFSRFYERHPAPADGDTSPAAQAYWRELAQAGQRWTDLWPDSPEAWTARFRGLVRSPDLAAGDLATAIDGVRRTSDEPEYVFQIARELVRHGVALDRVPELVEAGLAQVEAARPRIAGPVPAGERVLELLERQAAFEAAPGREVLFDLYVAQGRIDEARAALAGIERALPDESTPQPDAEVEAMLGHFRAGVWARRGALARAEGKPIDALFYYDAALAADPFDLDAPHAAALELAREVGAAEPAIRAWSEARAGIGVPFGAHKALELPAFALRDLSGRTWRKSDLEGKVALISVWAAWCGPCLEELPWLEKLGQRLSGREDVVLLTFNVDENPGIVEPILRRNGYTFPVVPAYDYIQKLWGMQWTIPCTWVVDRSGVARLEQQGFGPDGARWIESALAAIDRVGRGI